MKLKRAQLIVIAAFCALGAVLGVVIAKQDWSLEATAVIGFGVSSGLTLVGLLVVMLLDDGAAPTRMNPMRPFPGDARRSK